MGAKADAPVRARNTVVNKEIAKLANGSDVLWCDFGDQAQDVIWRLLNGELEAYRTRLFMVMIGTNNRGRPENIVAGLLASQQEGLRDLARRRHAHVPLDPREVVANVAADFLGARAY